NIQNIVQTEIHAYLEEIPAKSAAVIIQDPNTGAVLAMADSDDFDLNNPRDMSMHYTAEELDAMSDEEVTAALTTMWRNYCITQNFEPGSTFKPFTLAMGLEEDSVKMDDMYNCWGSLQFLDKVVGCHSEGGHGYIDTWTAIQESCNVGLMEMSQAIGKVDFCRYQRKFGFGSFTDIDLPHEADCNSFLYNDRNMSELDLATNSFGQNFNVTMIQMITGFSSLINGGHLYKPYVTQNIYTAQGEKVLSNDKTLVAETVAKTTSDTCKQAMRRVVAYGTGTDASVDGYVISGKTGTAEKAGREEGNYLISFIGFAPYDEPQVVCYVTIDEPSTGDAQGISAGLFRNIMEKVLPYLNIPTAAEDHDPEGIMTEGPGIVTTEDANAAEENYDEYYEEEYEEDYEEEYNEEN
ncbi:MAG: peptidoglycan glycosyltransferase, partial [Parasporobacterium sp.]|nr:peptidoglycan glycosyltransferase [Parasporobacterium sp.]